jgi:hypothetical protein
MRCSRERHVESLANIERPSKQLLRVLTVLCALAACRTDAIAIEIALFDCKNYRKSVVEMFPWCEAWFVAILGQSVWTTVKKIFEREKGDGDVLVPSMEYSSKNRKYLICTRIFTGEPGEKRTFRKKRTTSLGTYGDVSSVMVEASKKSWTALADRFDEHEKMQGTCVAFPGPHDLYKGEGIALDSASLRREVIEQHIQVAPSAKDPQEYDLRTRKPIEGGTNPRFQPGGARATMWYGHARPYVDGSDVLKKLENDAKRSQTTNKRRQMKTKHCN